MQSTDRVDRVELDGDEWSRRVLAAALAADVGLLALNYVFNFYDVTGDLSIRRIFNIAREVSVPTFYASLQAVAVGLTALALRSTDRPERRRAWTFVAVFWVYVGVDDNAEIHERVGSALERATEGSLSWWPSFSWQVFLAPLLAVGLLGSVMVAWRAVDRRRWALVACLACFAVAQGIDVLEGVDELFDDWADSLGVEPYTIGHGLRSIEETLEMLGTTAYWFVVLPFLASRVRGREIAVT